MEPLGDTSGQYAELPHKTLVLCSRGAKTRDRHLAKDFLCMLPHSKPEAKLDEKHDPGNALEELAVAKGCDSCIYLESRKREDLHMWITKTEGPRVKFLVHNVHTMGELKLTGNSIAGSRPLLHFDKAFGEFKSLRTLQYLLTQAFGTPAHHPKTFVDHIFCFFWADNRVWFRNYQIIERDVAKKEVDRSLMEIGPRFVLEPIRMQTKRRGEMAWNSKPFVMPGTAVEGQVEGVKKGKKKTKAEGVVELKKMKTKKKMKGIVLRPAEDYDVE